MSTWFYYSKTGVKPLTLHAEDELFSGRGYKAQRIEFHQRGITTADCFSLDLQKVQIYRVMSRIISLKHLKLLSPGDNFYSREPASKI